MKAFPDRPRLEVVRPYQYELVEDYRYGWSHDGDDHRLIARTGMLTDLSSIPQWLWSFIGHQDLGLGPPLLHDCLYRSGGDTFASQFVDHEKWISNGNAGSWSPVTGAWSRWDADRLFCRMQREIDIPRWKRRSSFYAVRGFGWNAWDKDEYL